MKTPPPARCSNVKRWNLYETIADDMETAHGISRETSLTVASYMLSVIRKQSGGAYYEEFCAELWALSKRELDRIPIAYDFMI